MTNMNHRHRCGAESQEINTAGEDQHTFQLCLVPGKPPQNREGVESTQTHGRVIEGGKQYVQIITVQIKGTRRQNN